MGMKARKEQGHWPQGTPVRVGGWETKDKGQKQQGQGGDSPWAVSHSARALRGVQDRLPASPGWAHSHMCSHSHEALTCSHTYMLATFTLMSTHTFVHTRAHTYTVTCTLILTLSHTHAHIVVFQNQLEPPH